MFHNFIKKQLAFFILIIIAKPIYAESILSLHTFLKQVIASNPKFVFKKNLYLAHMHDLKKPNAIYDWNVFSEMQHVQGLDLGFGSIANQASRQSLNTGIHKILPSGMRLELKSGIQANNDLFFPAFNLNGNQYSSNLSLQFSYPLLKNARGILDKHPIILADFSKSIQKIQYKEDIEHEIFLLTNTYLDWKLAYLSKDLLSKQLEQTKKQHVLIVKQVNANFSDNVDLILSKKILAMKQLQIKQIKSHYEQLHRKIVILYHGIANSNLNFIPDLNHTLTVKNDVSVTLKKIDSTNIVSLLLLKKSMEDYINTIQKHELYPQFDLIAGTNLLSNEATSSKIFHGIGNYKQHHIGIKFSKSLENTQAKQEHLKSRYNKHATHHEIELIKQNLETQIYDLHHELSFLKTRKADLQKLLSIEKNYEQLEITLYSQGRRVSKNFILKSQEEQLAIQIQIQELQINMERIANQILVIEDLYFDNYASIPTEFKDNKPKKHD